MAKNKGASEKQRWEIRNRKAWREYHVLEKVECGISLVGTEVKSIREGNIRIDEAYARIEDGQVWLIDASIGSYANAAAEMQHDPTRKRKLLLHRRQIAELETHVRQKGKTLVPLTVYFHRGYVKVEVAVVTGKRSYDKREAIKKRDQQRDIRREMSRRRR